MFFFHFIGVFLNILMKKNIIYTQYQVRNEMSLMKKKKKKKRPHTRRGRSRVTAGQTDVRRGVHEPLAGLVVVRADVPSNSIDPRRAEPGKTSVRLPSAE